MEKMKDASIWKIYNTEKYCHHLSTTYEFAGVWYDRWALAIHIETQPLYYGTRSPIYATTTCHALDPLIYDPVKISRYPICDVANEFITF